MFQNLFEDYTGSCLVLHQTIHLSSQSGLSTQTGSISPGFPSPNGRCPKWTGDFLNYDSQMNDKPGKLAKNPQYNVFFFMYVTPLQSPFLTPTRWKNESFTQTANFFCNVAIERKGSQSRSCNNSTIKAQFPAISWLGRASQVSLKQQNRQLQSNQWPPSEQETGH